MAAFVDNIIAFKVLYMLVTPFEKTDAFRLGIVDKDGVALKKVQDLKTDEEKAAYSYLNRLVFNLKRLIGKLPGGKTQIASLAAAYFLVKESYINKTTLTEENVRRVIDLVESEKFTLVEEQIVVEQFLALVEDGVATGAIANTAGAATATDVGAVRLSKDGKPISGIIGLPNYMMRRKKKLTSKMG